MKSIFTLLILAIGINLEVGGQSSISAIHTTYVSTSSTVNSYWAPPATASATFNSCVGTSFNYVYNNSGNNALKILDIAANSKTYFLVSNANALIKLRRVNNPVVSGSRTIISMEANSTPAACPSSGRIILKLPYNDRMENFLDNNYINQGTDNVFTNTGNADGNNNNIERVDILFQRIYTVFIPAEMGFSIFDRGNKNAHDGFKIAAIMSINASGDPTSFGPVVTIVGGNSTSDGTWGHPTPANGNITIGQYILRKDPVDPNLRVSSQVQQQVGGVFVSAADLGITAGQKIYGYSLLATDGIANPTSAQLLNINNTSVYPTNTTEADGGLDLMAITGLFTTGGLPLASAEELSGTVNGNEAQLKWSVNDVASGTKIELQRSTDARNYDAVYSVGAEEHGSFTDRNLTTTFYYRLKIVNASNEVHYSNTVTINALRPTKAKLYPTILQPGASLAIEGLDDGVYNVHFTSTDGRQIVSEVNIKNGFAMFRQASLARGAWFVSFIGKDAKLCHTSSIIVE